MQCVVGWGEARLQFSLGTLLEMHYDDVHFEKWRAKAPHGTKPTKRQSEYKVFRSVVATHQKQLCQRLELPQRIKALFRKPKDEENWATLQTFREALCDIAQGQRQIALASEEEAQDLALAIEKCEADAHWSSVGNGFPGIPQGSKIVAEKPPCKPDLVCLQFADSIRRQEPGTTVTFYTRPWEMDKNQKKKEKKKPKNPIEDPFAKQLFNNNFDMGKIARVATGGPFDVHGIFDKMLLTLWDALHLDMAETWAQKGVANVRANDCPELARYFLKGLDVGSEPLVDGMCRNTPSHLYMSGQTLSITGGNRRQ